MKILLSNDDGLYAPGIVLLANRLAEIGHCVVVVAPDRERSGAGHSITTEHPLYLRKTSVSGYSKNVETYKSNGTPSDCVMLGLYRVLSDADLVLAGINSGPNLGCDVFYSGTAAAAREAAFEKRRAMALSLCLSSKTKEEHYETAVAVSEILVAGAEDLFEEGRETFLNVNIPNIPLERLKGFRSTFTGRRRYRDRVLDCASPGRDKMYWLRGTPQEEEELEGSDVKAVMNDFVALSFLQYDTTDYKQNEHLGKNLATKIKLK